MDLQLTAADGHTLHAYRTGPAGARRGLVVLQEIFGVNAHMRRITDTLAAAGYAAICPALFDRAERGVDLGYGAADRARGIELRGRVPEAGTLADIAAAAAALPAGLPLGIIGYCWGGTLSWWGATRSEAFRAAVCYYGGGIAATRTETPHCPVQMHFGARDAGIPLSGVEQVRAAQPGVEVFVYDEAGHGFACEDRPDFRPAEAAVAEARSLEFLGRHLG